MEEIKRTPTPLYRFNRSLLNLFAENPWKPQDPSNKQTTDVPSTQVNLRVLTFNVWFDAIFKEERMRELMRVVMEENPDVCCLQEITPTFEKTLRDDARWRETWLMTGLTDQLLYTNSSYGTMIMVNKRFLKKSGLSANAFFVEFPGSTTGRCLTLVELSRGIPQVPIISIGTVHLDYTPELREKHMNISIRALCTSSAGTPTRASLICGDTNISNYSELNPLLDSGFADSWLTTNPDASGGDVMFTRPTYGQTGVKIGGKAPGKELWARRLDYIMCHDFKIVDCKVVGDSPIAAKKLKDLTAEQLEGLEVFPSDHIGVLASLEVQ